LDRVAVAAALPTGLFLRQLIGFYGDNLQSLVPRYLEAAMGSFARQQEQMRTTMQKTMEGLFPPGLEEMGRQNMAMMERAMSLFAPFYGRHAGSAGVPPERDTGEEIRALQAEIERLRRQLEAVEKPK